MSTVGAIFAGADLRRVCLFAAQLEGSDLQNARLRNAVYDAATVWPGGMAPGLIGGDGKKQDVLGYARANQSKPGELAGARGGRADKELAEAESMLKALPQASQDSLGASVPFPKRLGEPREYADLVLFIVRSNYLNGEVIRLDGALRMAPR